jgi:putative redox protein
MADITLNWVKGLEFSVETTTGATLVTKSPKDEGPPGISPMQLLLVGLAGCTAMDITYLLKKMRNQLESMNVEIESERASDHPKVYTHIRLHFRVKGNINEQDLNKAIDLSKSKYCSAGAMFEKTANIAYTYEIVPTSSA